jgi:hypothetical protein
MSDSKIFKIDNSIPAGSASAVLTEDIIFDAIKKSLEKIPPIPSRIVSPKEYSVIQEMISEGKLDSLGQPRTLEEFYEYRKRVEKT